MNYYLVIHDVLSFHQHGDWIGKTGSKTPAEFSNLKRGDGIVYYCLRDSVITGAFRVAGTAKIVTDDPHWKGPHTVVPITPVAKAKPPRYISVKQMLEELEPPLSIFPDRKLSGIKLRGRTLVPITKQDFQAVRKYIPNYQEKDPPFQGVSNDAGMGEPGDYGVMKFAPTSEQGVVALFVHHIQNLGFTHLEFIRAQFPDACAIQKRGETYERKFIEFEYKASAFRQHVNDKKHRKIRCDYVVCWENDFLTCPVKVIALKDEMPKLLGKVSGESQMPPTIETPPTKETPAAKKKPDKKKAAKKAKKEGTRRPAENELVSLVKGGHLPPGTELRLTTKGETFKAVVQPDGTITMDGKTYMSLSAAGSAARQGKATNGWRHWKLERDGNWVEVAEVRAEARGK